MIDSLAAAMLALAAPAAAAAAPAPVAVQKVAEADGSHSLVHEVIVAAPAGEVWTAISTAEGWKSWAVPVAWAPSPDLIETSYTADAKPGDPSTIRQQVLARVPGRLMAFRTVKAPARFPDFDTYDDVVSVFELEPLGPALTRVRLTGTGYAGTDAGQRLLDFFEQGNRVSLEKLAGRFGTAAPPLRAELEPLRFLVGHCWRGTFAGGEVDTHCFEPAQGGQHVRDRHEVTGGKRAYAGETLYSWNGSRIEYAYWNSSGGVSRGSVDPQGGVLGFGDQRYRGPDGKEILISTRWERVGDDGYRAVTASGADPTGSRAVEYRRID